MENWRKSRCGTVALRSALEGGQSHLNLAALNEAAGTMSCGGMHIPSWQTRFAPQSANPSTSPTESQNWRVLHLAVQDKKRASMLMLALSHKPNADASHALSTAEIPHANMTAMVEEIGVWWNKN